MYGAVMKRCFPLSRAQIFFADPLAPRGGELLILVVAPGIFLAAARDRGYGITGIELDRNAARFAKERLGLQRVFPLTISEFAEQHAKNVLMWSHFLKCWSTRPHRLNSCRR